MPSSTPPPPPEPRSAPVATDYEGLEIELHEIATRMGNPFQRDALTRAASALSRAAEMEKALAALRQRASDLELMLRAAWNDGARLFKVPTYSPAGVRLGHRLVIGFDEHGKYDLRGQPEMQDDGTGLPILTDQARSALGGEA